MCSNILWKINFYIGAPCTFPLFLIYLDMGPLLVSSLSLKMKSFAKK